MKPATDDSVRPLLLAAATVLIWLACFWYGAYVGYTTVKDEAEPTRSSTSA